MIGGNRGKTRPNWNSYIAGAASNQPRPDRCQKVTVPNWPKSQSQHQYRRTTGLLLLLVITLLGACKGYDSNFIPYALKGLDVWVYNNETDREFYGGRIEARYWNRSEALSSCSGQAYAVARERHLQDWSYICCTVTSSSDCVTKVR